MRFPRAALLASLAAALPMLLLAVTDVRSARADDGMFPAAPAAKSAIDFDGRGFLVNGRREFIVSGTLHYPRVPRALWRDRLLRIKSAGFNCIETYAFWNLHEAHEGKWNFSGDNDLSAYLKLIKELGMYAIVRVGPYVCAEWDSGGYPVWLRFKPGVRVREDNRPFEEAVDRWYEKVIPIVAAEQIHRGGPVIMVQMENEHPQGWGKEMPNGYFRHLRDKAVSLGLEVPCFFSGLHHGSDPAGNRPWDSRDRTNPWFTTEFWPGWYDLYGPLDDQRYTKFVRGTWKILAYGGNGYNFYMLHGGTNFGTWNDDEVASCYDYGAAVGQTGDLRPIYYAFKQAALFARSFADVLENSENATSEYAGSTTESTVRVTARKSPAGSLLFLDNNSGHPVETQVKLAGGALFPSHPMTIAPHEIRPMVHDYKLQDDIVLEACSARILGIARQGETTSIVVFGSPGKATGIDRVDIDARPEPKAELVFNTLSGGLDITQPAAQQGVSIQTEGLAAGRSRVRMAITLPVATERNPVRAAWFSAGKRRVRVIALAHELAQRTWFTDVHGRTYVVCGPEYVSGLEDNGGRLSLAAEAEAQRGYSRASFARPYDTSVFTPSGTEEILRIKEPAVESLLARPGGGSNDVSMKDYQPPTLSEWQRRDGAPEAAPSYFAGRWKFDSNPPKMGADGDTSAYAWYRASVRAPKEGAYTLAFSDAGDWLAVYVNGLIAGSSRVKERFDKPVPRMIAVPLKNGDNDIAVLAAHFGRHKLFNYLGPIDTIDAKGLDGPVYLSRETAGSTAVTSWRWKPAAARDASLTEAPAHMDTAGPGWTNAKIGEDVFAKKPGFAWFDAMLPSSPGPHHRIHFDGVDDNATVFLNGKKVAFHKGWNEPFDVPLDTAWRTDGRNELIVLVENNDNTGGIVGDVEIQTNSPEDGTPIRGWRERGGIDDPMSGQGWTRVSDPRGSHGPSFYRAEFDNPTPGVPGARAVLRLSTAGLSRGFVWLNGHNLGRYPEKTPAPGLYLPECWLKTGGNTIVVFDEDGNSPAQARVVVEPEACRLAYTLESAGAKGP